MSEWSLLGIVGHAIPWRRGSLIRCLKYGRLTQTKEGSKGVQVTTPLGFF